MNKIKTVKIKNPDGSISEETYTISIDAENVDMENGKDLQDTIGTINIDKDGNIASQLENLNTNVDELNINIEKKPYYFNTVAEMKDYDFNAGDYVITKGYYQANDGGGSRYIIRNKNSDDTNNNGSIIVLNNNNLVAELLIENNIVSVKQFGAYGDNTHDDIIAFENAISFINGKYMTLYVDKGKYYLSRKLVINWSNANYWQNFNGSYKFKGSGPFTSILRFTSKDGVDTTHISLRNEWFFCCKWWL